MINSHKMNENKPSLTAKKKGQRQKQLWSNIMSEPYIWFSNGSVCIENYIAINDDYASEDWNPNIVEYV